MHTHPVILNSRPYQLIEMHNYMYYINPTFHVHFDNSMIVIDLVHDTSACGIVSDTSMSMVPIPDMSGSDTSMSMVPIPDISGYEMDTSMITLRDISGLDTSMAIIPSLPKVADMSEDAQVDIVDIKDLSVVQEPTVRSLQVNAMDVSDSSMILVGTIGDKSIIILSEDCSGIYLNKNADIIQVDAMDVKEVIDPSSCVTTLRPLDVSGQMHHYYHHAVYDSSRVVLDTSGSGHFHYHNPSVTLDIRGVPNYHYVIYLCEYHMKDVVDEIPSSTGLP
jgi:hypothetical protein